MMTIMTMTIITLTMGMAPIVTIVPMIIYIVQLVRNGGGVVGGARRQKTVTNPYLGLLG